MADVFLSYKREERDAVEKIAASLRSLNLSVWFDSSLDAGSAFPENIERELAAATAVLVCWSPSALNSTWVRAEALAAITANKIVSCQIAGVENVMLPLPFNTLHTEDLREWLKKQSYGHASWKGILRTVGRLSGRADLATWGALDGQSTIGQLQDWIAHNKNSPLFMATHEMLLAREKKNVERALAEEAAKAQREKEELARLAQKKLDEEKKLAQEKLQQEATDKEERKKRSVWRLTVGAVIAMPVFFVVYAIVGALAFAGMMIFQWLGAERTGGLTRMADLVAAGVSGFYGVQAGRFGVDFVIKIWAGWPTFLTLAGVWTAALYALATQTDLSKTWWLLVVGGLHSIVAIGAAYAFLAKKE